MRFDALTLFGLFAVTGMLSPESCPSPEAKRTVSVG
jgi:hypothetical protein